MMHGISAGPLYRRDGEFKWNNYANRYHDMHVDLMDVLSGYGASKWVGLGLLSPLMGLPGKSFLTDAIWEHVLRGEEAIVREYCKMDVLETLLLFLVYAVHCGQLEAERLRAYVETIRATLRDESFEGWGEVAARLEGWPSWAQEDEVRARCG
jgi:predicted PolB exonuclease-like 3'-5' exonuclease